MSTILQRAELVVIKWSPETAKGRKSQCSCPDCPNPSPFTVVGEGCSFEGDFCGRCISKGCYLSVRAKRTKRFAVALMDFTTLDANGAPSIRSISAWL